MRTLKVSEITEAVKEMCIEANHFLTEDMKCALEEAALTEESILGRQILEQLQENLRIAGDDRIPICQDTGMAVIFVEVGQEIYFEGGTLTEAIQEGVRKGYQEGFLRKSVVKEPLIRENTRDNTPAVIHYDIVSGDRVKITVAPKGFGSENMSEIVMLTPAAGLEGALDFIVDVVRRKGANACPPLVVGVGIGGTFEKCALMAKHSLIRELGSVNEDKELAELEEQLLERINALDIGPMGLGGKITALGVFIEKHPTHIAGLPVAVNIMCHALRHERVLL